MDSKFSFLLIVLTLTLGSCKTQNVDTSAINLVKNKLPELFIKSFQSIFKKVLTLTIPNEPNSIKAEELKLIAKKYIPADRSSNIQTALKKLSSKEKKTIVVFGSLYLIGDVLNKN